MEDFGYITPRIKIWSNYKYVDMKILRMTYPKFSLKPNGFFNLYLFT